MLFITIKMKVRTLEIGWPEPTFKDFLEIEGIMPIMGSTVAFWAFVVE